MIIELTNLAPYLPYDLCYVSPAHEAEFLMDFTKPETIEIMSPISMLAICENNYKVILKPLNTVGEEELRGQGFHSYIDYLTHELHNPRNAKRLDSDGKPLWRIGAVPFEMVQYLITQHYDVFGLIQNDLAVNYYDIIGR